MQFSAAKNTQSPLSFDSLETIWSAWVHGTRVPGWDTWDLVPYADGDSDVLLGPKQQQVYDTENPFIQGWIVV